MTPTTREEARLDRPEVVAEVLAAFHAYEQALVEGDVDTLNELFWDDPRCLRYGIADRQRGTDAIAQWRREHPAVPAGRRLRETHVLAVDDGTAVVNTLFDHPGRPRRGTADPGVGPAGAGLADRLGTRVGGAGRRLGSRSGSAATRIDR